MPAASTDQKSQIEALRVDLDQIARLAGGAIQNISTQKDVNEAIVSRLLSVEAEAKVAGIHAALEQINTRLNRIETLSHGAKAVYVGNDRLLTRMNFGNLQLMYLVEADDLLIVPHFVMEGCFEPEVTNFFARTIRDADHCLDVGANFGYYSCLMGRLAWRGKTLAIEPDRKIFELLRDNALVNWLQQQITPFHGAVADREGTVRLYRCPRQSGNTRIINTPQESLSKQNEQQIFEVRSVTIDSLLPQLDGRIDIMKIDVEGAEPLAFRGMTETFNTNPKIQIVMEWSPEQIQTLGFDVRQFIADLAALGLKPYIIGRDGAAAATWDQVANQQYLSGLLLHR